MRKCIVFHADVDGVFCAALYMNLKIESDDSYKLYPVFSSFRGQKFSGIVRSMNLKKDDELLIFDFENHNRSDYWVDHHPDISLGDQNVISNKILYTPRTQSAFEPLFNEIGNKEEKFMKDIIKDVNMIDSASYPSVEYVANDTSPIMIIRAALENASPSDNSLYCRMVEVLANTNFNLQETISRMNLDYNVVKNTKSRMKDIKKYATIHNKISIVRQKRVAEFPRYSECLMMPDVKYNIRITPIFNQTLIQIGYNKWHKEENTFDIGRFFSYLRYVKGGGHFNVGGGTIMFSHNVEKLLDNFSKACGNEEQEGNEQEGNMEKYGVDKKLDQVEKKADEMVKSGEFTNINEAREAASEGAQSGNNDGKTEGNEGDTSDKS